MDRLDFVLSQGATLLGSTETIEMDLVYSLSLAGQNASVTVGMHGEFDFSGENPIESANVELRVQNGTEFVDFEMALNADNSLDGVIKYNGVDVVYISGTEGDPVFESATGEPADAGGSGSPGRSVRHDRRRVRSGGRSVRAVRRV